MRTFITFIAGHLNICVVFCFESIYIFHPPVEAHWNFMKCGYLHFIFVHFPYALFFFCCVPLFSVNILGTRHYAYHPMMMIKINYCTLLELGVQVWKKNGERYGDVICGEELTC